LAGLVHSWEWKDPKDTSERQFKDAGLDLRDRRIRKFFQLYQAVQDLPRHLGQHSGGMVILSGDSSIQLCRSSRRRCPGASSCNGTKKIVPISELSKLICWDWNDGGAGGDDSDHF
jgi:hypothetical protein